MWYLPAAIRPAADEAGCEAWSASTGVGTRIATTANKSATRDARARPGCDNRKAASMARDFQVSDIEATNQHRERGAPSVEVCDRQGDDDRDVPMLQQRRVDDAHEPA